MTRRPHAPSAHVIVRGVEDVAIARLTARDLALAHGFAPERADALTIAVSELAMNIVVHAGGSGDIHLEVVSEAGRRGIVAVARDASPGIRDVAAALEDGFSTSGGLGLGLPAARRLVDDFTLVSAVGEGTVVTIRKWAHADR